MVVNDEFRYFYGSIKIKIQFEQDSIALHSINISSVVLVLCFHA